MIYVVSNQTSLFDSNVFFYISINEALELLMNELVLGLDTETEGLDVFTKKLLLLQIGTQDFQVVIDVASFNHKIPHEIVSYLNNSSQLFVIQNAKFDLKFLLHQQVLLKKVYDTMLAEIILTNGLQYSGRDLATLTSLYLGDKLDKSIRGKIVSKGLATDVLLYGAKDVEVLLPIRQTQLEKIETLQLAKAVALDNSFVIVLAYTEYCGIKLDYDQWLLRASKNQVRQVELLKKLNDQLHQDEKFQFFSGMWDLFTGELECLVNWDSPKQVLAVFKSYGINTQLKVKGVLQDTVDSKVLEPQVSQFAILPIYLEYKEIQKDLSTYGSNWRKYINPVTNRIHTTFQQIVDTGRLSSGNKHDGTVNLQNIPSDVATRSCFIPEPGNLMIDADFSSQEQVVLANFSQEPNLINFYARGFKDMHSYIAFLMYPHIRRCSVEELTPEKLLYIKKEYADKRFLAKIAGFSINYGGGGSTIAKNCNIPLKDGQYVYDSYFKAFPQLKEYFDWTFQRAAYYGYVEFNSVTRRKYFFNKTTNNFFELQETVEDPNFWYITPDAKRLFNDYKKAKSEVQRIAQNFPIQGSSSDITKYAGILFFKEILKNNWLHTVKIINFVHDEILVEAPSELAEEVKNLLLQSMENAGKPFCTQVSLKAEAKIGNSWIH
jgi:DNA polymerase I-like protein with 3'-5' exonuclease and polymerase domains